MHRESFLTIFLFQKLKTENIFVVDNKKRAYNLCMRNSGDDRLRLVHLMIHSFIISLLLI